MKETEKGRNREGRKDNKVKKKVGRPNKTEMLRREKSWSASSTKTMEDYVKRKREEEQLEGDMEQNEVFKRSKKIGSLF